jgi:hypothetical protein
MIRLLAILLLAFFAVTFLLAIVRRFIRQGGISGMDNNSPADSNDRSKDKKRIVDAKYEEIK